jgi:exocyst complex component 3
MSQGKNLVAKKYLLAIMSRKVAFKNQEERKKASDKINIEAGQVRNLFERIGSAGSLGKQPSCPFNAIEAVAEVVKVEDLDILSLELHSFIKHYPDLTKEQLMAILSLRGDIGRFDLKQRATEIIPGASAMKGPVPHSIFSAVHIPPSLFNV